MLPVSRDALDGPERLAVLAEAHAAAGHADSAFAQLRTLVSFPASPAAGSIEFAPGWASLRNDPRFKEIMKKSRR